MRIPRALNLIVFGLGVIGGFVLSLFLLPIVAGFIQYLATRSDPTNVAHILAYFASLVLMSTPLSIGATFVMVAAGFVFGWWAFPMVYIAYICGGMITFLAVRLMVNKGWVTIEMVEKQFKRHRMKIAAFESSISDHGILTCVLLQLSIIPYGVASALLPLTQVSALTYLKACMLSRLKLIILVWIGVSATDIISLIDSLRHNSFSALGERKSIPALVSLIGSLLALTVISIFSQRKLELMRRESVQKHALHLPNNNSAQGMSSHRGAPDSSVGISSERRESPRQIRVQAETVEMAAMRSTSTSTCAGVAYYQPTPPQPDPLSTISAMR